MGGSVDVYHDPAAKDLVGWRGPCDVVNNTKHTKGKLSVEWQSRTITVPLNEVRPHNLLAFFAAEGGAALFKLMRTVDTQCVFTLMGKVPAHNGPFLSQGSQQWPELKPVVNALGKNRDLKVVGWFTVALGDWLPANHVISGTSLTLAI